jgi:hypothetical protein
MLHEDIPNDGAKNYPEVSPNDQDLSHWNGLKIEVGKMVRYD